MTPPVQPDPVPAFEDRRHSSKVTRAMYRTRHRAKEAPLTLAADVVRGLVGIAGAAYFARHIVVDLGGTGDKEAGVTHLLVILGFFVLCLGIAFGKWVWKTLKAGAGVISAWKGGKADAG
jgi:hypothetical protein